MKLYIGITKDEELYYIEYDKPHNLESKHFSLCGGTYRDPKDQETGEREARERLEDRDYWSDLGYLENTDHNPVLNHIDFKALADEVLSSDGWENTNGEYEPFGEYEGKQIYLSLSSCGQHKEEIKDLKECWVDKKDLKQLYHFWDTEHLKPLKERTLKFMEVFFDKYKSLCGDQEALNKYLKGIK